MIFSEILHLHMDLKRRLIAILGKNVFSDITINPPKGDSDELSFIRLVSWGYVLIHESGRGVFSYLRKLPPLESHSGQLLPHLHALRTWASHNLIFEKERDIRTVQTATIWLMNNCQTGSPTNSSDWKKCFDAMAADLRKLLLDCISACDCFEQSDDRDELIKSFRNSLDRNWEAYLFDEYVDNALKTFGYTGLSPTILRSQNLDAWRKIVASSIDDDSIKRNLTIRIENDVLKLMASSLPILSQEVVGIIQHDEPDYIAAAMLFLRQSSGENLENLHSTLTQLNRFSASTR